MLVERREVERYLSQKFTKSIFNTEECNKLYDYAYSRYNMNKGDFADFISMRKDIGEATVFMLFIMCDSYDNNHANARSSCKKFFTQKEIDSFKAAKFEKEKIEFPLVFKVIQVADDQWIGKISSDMLLKMKNFQIINYDPNTQRAMQKIVRGDKEMYKISVDNKAVNSIMDSMLKGRFIPNVITLNIPENETDYYFDEEKCEFVINSIRFFNINDGYHRYLAISKAKEIDAEFKQNMELRITTFDITKAQLFIFQEDQKTKMTKHTSNSYNLYAAENMITKKINEDPLCNICGMISRNDGNINFAEFAFLVKYFYYGKEYKTLSEDKKYLLKVKKELVDKWNMITELEPGYLDRKIKYQELIAIFVVVNNCKDSSKYIKAIKALTELDFTDLYIANNISRKVMNKMMERLEEVI